MPDEREIGYRLLLKPTGGLWLLFTDRTLIDIDLTPADMRSLASDLLELADQVEKMPRGLPHPSAKAITKC